MSETLSPVECAALTSHATPKTVLRGRVLRPSCGHIATPCYIEYVPPYIASEASHEHKPEHNHTAICIGANNTIVSPQAAGLSTVQLSALRATRAGTGAEGDAIAREVSLSLERRAWLNRRVLVMNLDNASKPHGYAD